MLSTLTFEVEIELAVEYLSDLSGPLGSAPSNAKQKTKDPCWPGGIFWHLNSSVWNPSMLIFFHVRDPVLCSLFELCWLPVPWSSRDNIAYLLGSHSGLNRKIVLSPASSKSPHTAGECDFYVHCKV